MSPSAAMPKWMPPWMPPRPTLAFQTSLPVAGSSAVTMPDFWPPSTRSRPSPSEASIVAAPKSKSGPPSFGQLSGVALSQAVFQASPAVAW